MAQRRRAFLSRSIGPISTKTGTGGGWLPRGSREVADGRWCGRPSLIRGALFGVGPVALTGVAAPAVAPCLMLQCSNASIDGTLCESWDKSAQSRYVAALQHDSQNVSGRSSARSAAPD